jgi:F1F0 ATPase subunit 2
MIDLILLLLAFIAGLMLGTLFFGGLWWTLQNYRLSENPAVWFVGSSMLRMALLMLGLFFITSGDWKRALAALLGVMIARVLVTKYAQWKTTKLYAAQ